MSLCESNLEIEHVFSNFITVLNISTLCKIHHGQISSVSSLTERDIVIGISNSGNSKLLLHIFEIAKKRGAKTVCITSHIKSPLAQAADYQLNTVSNEKLFFDGFSYNRIPSIAVIDVLFLLFSKRSVKDTYNYISDKEQLLSDYKF